MTEIQQILEAIARLEKKVNALMEPQSVPEPAPPKWVTPGEAAKIIGLSPWQMRARIRDGRWKHGREYIDTSDGTQPRYRINLAVAGKIATTPPEKRHPGNGK